MDDVSLKEHLLQTLNERDSRYEQRFNALEEQLDRIEQAQSRERYGISWGVALSVIGITLSLLSLALSLMLKR